MNEAEPARKITIERCKIEFDGQQLLAVIRGLQSLPYGEAKPLIEFIEGQLRAQFPPTPPPMPDHPNAKRRRK